MQYQRSNICTGHSIPFYDSKGNNVEGRIMA